MTEKDIKPMPKYIQKLIKKADDKADKTLLGRTRFYAYLAIWHKELVKVTVAVKNHRKKWLCKQVAVHGIHSDKCFLKDIVFYYVSGYVVGWFEQGVGRNPRWFESPEWGWNEDKYFDPYAPIVNRNVIDKLPEYKYSAYTLYDGVDILQYLRLYEKYPHTEYLLKLGLAKYVHSKQILEKTVKDKSFRKWLAKNREELKRGYFYISTIMKAYKTNGNLQRIEKCERAKKNLRDFKHKPLVRELFGSFEKFLDYITVQNTTAYSYADYINACDYLGIDLHEPKNYMPHDFKRWHDIRIDERRTARALKDEEERKFMNEKFAYVAEKYLTLQHNKRSQFICVIAKSQNDLIDEGEHLHHCVGGMNYGQKFSREETLIFFVRNKATPTVPFVTLEYSLQSRKVLQCHGDNNVYPSDDVMHYVNKIWLPHANRQLRRIAA